MALLFILRPARSPYLDSLRQGDEHAARTERTAAVAAYAEAAQLRPHDPAPYLRLARLNLDWGRTEDAMDALVEAGRRGGGAIELERLWVAVHLARGDRPAVVEHAQRLLELAPGDRTAIAGTLRRTNTGTPQAATDRKSFATDASRKPTPETSTPPSSSATTMING